MLGEVTEVFLRDGNPNDIYKIRVSLNKTLGRKSDVDAYPLNPYIKSVPVVGENVYLIVNSSSESKPYFIQNNYYYISPTFLHRALNNNILPELVIDTVTNSPNSTNYDSPPINKPQLSQNISKTGGPGFVIDDNISQMQPFIGDVIFEGRFGQSIRFGYTPNNPQSSNNPSWISTSPKSPITIIKNGVSKNSGYDKFIIEDVNNDKSSIWLTDKQKIKIKISNKTSITDPQKLPGSYSNPQIIINSDRLIFNSKSDSIILSGKNNIYMSTSKYKADVNELISIVETLFTTVESINQTLVVLTTAYSALTAPPLTPIGAPAAVANSRLNSTVLPKITELKTRFTKIKNV